MTRITNLSTGNNIQPNRTLAMSIKRRIIDDFGSLFQLFTALSIIVAWLYTRKITSDELVNSICYLIAQIWNILSRLKSVISFLLKQNQAIPVIGGVASTGFTLRKLSVRKGKKPLNMMNVGLASVAGGLTAFELQRYSSIVNTLSGYFGNQLNSLHGKVTMEQVKHILYKANRASDVLYMSQTVASYFTGGNKPTYMVPTLDIQKTVKQSLNELMAYRVILKLPTLLPTSIKYGRLTVSTGKRLLQNRVRTVMGTR